MLHDLLSLYLVYIQDEEIEYESIEKENPVTICKKNSPEYVVH